MESDKRGLEFGHFFEVHVSQVLSVDLLVVALFELFLKALYFHTVLIFEERDNVVVLKVMQEVQELVFVRHERTMNFLVKHKVT